MKRTLRAVTALALVLLTVPLGADAQQAAKVHRIGLLGVASVSAYASLVEAFRQGLRDLGYVEGKNIVIEYRWAEGKYDRLPELAAELIRLPVDLIVTHATPGSRAAKQTTATIPIVMATSGDAVAAGLVASLARPGGNVTGLSILFPELSAKRLELLKDGLRDVSRAPVLWNANNPAHPLAVKAMELTAPSLGLELQQFGVRGLNDFDSVFPAMTKWRADAVAVLEDPMINSHHERIVGLAVKNRLPTIGSRELAEAGGLLGYGADFHELWRRAATFVDKILKGAKPADLPVEQPTKFELVINARTAKALGLTILPALLLRADRVIE
ncbi:MAG: ABC transporter substrate-binding protein [Candidatus Rokubacteria bacterium]|nr:ABC transporter substrate-binding protein [Candidatus Rokubacteria bacterium]